MEHSSVADLCLTRIIACYIEGEELSTTYADVQWRFLQSLEVRDG